MRLIYMPQDMIDARRTDLAMTAVLILLFFLITPLFVLPFIFICPMIIKVLTKSTSKPPMSPRQAIRNITASLLIMLAGPILALPLALLYLYLAAKLREFERIDNRIQARLSRSADIATTICEA